MADDIDKQIQLALLQQKLAQPTIDKQTISLDLRLLAVGLVSLGSVVMWATSKFNSLEASAEKQQQAQALIKQLEDKYTSMDRLVAKHTDQIATITTEQEKAQYATKALATRIDDFKR